jgi:hypothetical protein
MPNLPYKTAGWDTHTECKFREIDFPLFEQGCTDHFTILRTFEGPAATYAVMPLDALDSDFDGSTRTGVVGEADDESLTFAAAHKLFTGCPVTVANVSGMTGLSAGAFFAIRLSATVIKLASTLANARAGTAVAFSADGTCDVTLPAAYFVRQGPKRDADGEQVRYERLFSTVPSQWSDPESFAFEFPAFPPGTPGTSFSATSIANSTPGTVIIGTNATGISVGDTVYAQVKYTRAGVIYAQTFFGKATAASSGSSVSLPGTMLGSVGAASSVTGTVAETAAGRTNAESLTVGSRIVHDYALSSIANLDTDLPVSQQFRPLDNTGSTTSLLSATSIPTASAYATMVVDGTEIVAESSVRRRYLGNIYVRSTRMVRAQ